MHATRQHNVARTRRPRTDRPCAPTHATDVARLPQHRITAALGDHLAIAFKHSADVLDINILGDTRSGPNTQPADDALSAIVAQLDLPVRDPVTIKLDRRRNAVSRSGQNIILGTPRPVQDRQPGWKPTSTSPADTKPARRNRFVLEKLHIGQQMTVIELIHPRLSAASPPDDEPALVPITRAPSATRCRILIFTGSSQHPPQ